MENLKCLLLVPILQVTYAFLLRCKNHSGISPVSMFPIIYLPDKILLRQSSGHNKRNISLSKPRLVITYIKSALPKLAKEIGISPLKVLKLRSLYRQGKRNKK